MPTLVKDLVTHADAKIERAIFDSLFLLETEADKIEFSLLLMTNMAGRVSGILSGFTDKEVPDDPIVILEFLLVHLRKQRGGKPKRRPPPPEREVM